MVCGAMDLMLGGGYGNSTIIRTKIIMIIWLIASGMYIYFRKCCTKSFSWLGFASIYKILVDLSENCCAEKFPLIS